MPEAVEIPPGTMTREEFHRWMAGQPQGRFELDNGRVVAMAAERIAHTRARHRAWLALRDAAAAAGVPCKALGDGVSVAVDERTNYEPDALLNCGEVAAGDAIAAPNPLVVVEVTSPSNSRIDLDTRFIGYFRVPSIRHYLIVHLTERVVLHHARRQDGRIESAILGTGALALDPPGIALRIEDLFEG